MRGGVRNPQNRVHLINHNYTVAIVEKMRWERKQYVEVLAIRTICSSAVNLIRKPKLLCAKVSNGIKWGMDRKAVYQVLKTCKISASRYKRQLLGAKMCSARKVEKG